MEDEGWWVKWREQPSKQWCLSEILRRFKAPGGSALRYSRGQPRLGAVSRPGYSPSTHKHTHSRTLWGSYCHGNQPLYDYSLHRRIIGTNLSQPLSLSLSVSFFSFFPAAISSRPSSSPGPAPFSPLLHVQERTLHVLLFPPSSPLSSLRVSDSHEFDLLCIIYPRWDLYSSHKWKKQPPNLHKHYAGCFLAAAKETWWKEGLFVISKKAGEQNTWLKIEK